MWLWHVVEPILYFIGSHLYHLGWFWLDGLILAATGLYALGWTWGLVKYGVNPAVSVPRQRFAVMLLPAFLWLLLATSFIDVLDHHRSVINDLYSFLTVFTGVILILFLVATASLVVRSLPRPRFHWTFTRRPVKYSPAPVVSPQPAPIQQAAQQQTAAPVATQESHIDINWMRIAAGFDMDRLRDVVIGQNLALEEVKLQLRIGATKRLHDSKKPVSVMLLVGPSGVGKTETAKAVATVCDLPLVTFDMSEFYDRHTASRLVGSPPGYIGSERGGQLTQAVKRYASGCVILFDEIEKADMSVHTMFLQIFDEGRLTDASTGEQVSFANAVIFMTSNLCQEAIRDVMSDAINSITPAHRLQVLELLRRGDAQGRRLPPELLGRISAVIPFSELQDCFKYDIVENWLQRSPLSGYFTMQDILQNVDIYSISDTYGVRGMINEVERYCYSHLPRGVVLN